MNEFENRVKKYIESHTTLDFGAGPVIVALSGGADSVALLAVAVSLGFDCVAAHCNFGLRGEESDRDTAHAASVAKRLGARFEVVYFDVEKRRRSTGESVEMACRELRYNWFRELRERYSAQAVLTGHHRDDNIETMFLNMFRGSGLNGVAGIVPEGDRRVSPLLGESRESILGYLKVKGLDYVTDSTNLETEYQRNKIRNIILPAIAGEFPGVMARIGDSLSFLMEDRCLLNSCVESWRQKYFIAPLKLDLRSLADNEPASRAIAFKLLQPFGFSRCVTDSMLESAHKSGLTFESKGNCRAVLSRGILEIENGITEAAADEAVAVTFRIVADADLKAGNRNVAFFDSAILEDNPQWEIRPWKTGDRMNPFGMNGRRKKLSDIFNDMKMSAADKKKIRLLCRNGEVIWILGIRQSDLFRVTDTTERIAVLTFGGDGELLCRSTQ